MIEDDDLYDDYIFDLAKMAQMAWLRSIAIGGNQGGGAPAVPVAPSLAVTSASGANPVDITLTPVGWQSGDQFFVRGSKLSDFSDVDTTPDSLDPGPIDGSGINTSLVMPSDGTWYLNAGVKRGGGAIVWNATVLTVVVDTTAPTITSSASISLAENTALSQTLTANESVTWSIVGGADQAKFSLVGATLSMPAKDYEVPTDADANNTYVVTVRATDTYGHTTDQTITVTVTDVVEGVSGAFLTSALDAVDRTTYTFTSQPIGAAAADRLIVVAVSSRGNTSPSVTVAGIAATLIDSQVNSVTSITALFVASVPAGTTGDVVVTFTGSAANCGIGLWRIVGASTSVPAGVNKAKASASSGATSISATLTVPVGGFWIGVTEGIIASGSSFALWSVGVERYDGPLEGGLMHAAADGTETGSVPVTVNFSPALSSTGGAGGGLVVASWGP